MVFPGAAKVRISAGPVVKVKIVRSRPSYARADSTDIPAGTDEVVVVFNTPLPAATWVFAGLSLVNHADNPDLSQYLSIKGVSAPSQSGFTVKLSAPTISANYKLHWAITEELNP